MRKTHTYSGLAVLSLALITLAVATTSQMTGALSADECVGKPYGYPGCPTWNSQSSPGPKCGNAILDTGEECDEGRFNGQTTCGTNCMKLFCGDGTLSPNLGEECEPASTDYTEFYVKKADGSLTTERHYRDPPSCGSYCQPPSIDAHTAGCRWVFGQMCEAASSQNGQAGSAGTQAATAASAGTSGATQTLPPAMNNGVPGTQTGTSPATAPVTCGDGKVDAGEQCDDGNRINIDGCTNLCRQPVCGDGVVHPGEQCDDGNDNNADSCSNTCQSARCGDTITQMGEQCDDGNQVNTDGCTNACRLPSCGDGIQQIYEQCDDGNQVSTDICTNNCRLPVCGDGVVQNDEECDDGNQNNSDTCTNTCHKSRCGDGIKQTGEQCDDGNDNSLDACTNLCRLPVCGNAAVEGREECDDGNKSNWDACSNTCKLTKCGDAIVQIPEECDQGDANSDTQANMCRSNCKNPFCGDRVIDQGEACDGGAHCTSSCTFRTDALKSGPNQDDGSMGSAESSLFGVKKRVAVGGLTAIFGVLILLSTVFFRKELLALGSKAKIGGSFAAKADSIEDITLDKIEMPWHKW